MVNNSGVGTLTLQNVPNTSYNFYLYGANFDGTRGAQFSVNSGTPLGGYSATVNPYSNGGSGPLDTFILGADYVEFTGVAPDV